MSLNQQVLEKLIDACLAEDVGSGDLTTDGIVPPDLQALGFIKAKQAGVVAGLPVARAVFQRLDPNFGFAARVDEGARIAAGDVLAELRGLARAMLTGERLALNFLQRLSGIATITADMTARIKGYAVRLVDTRKTTPGLRHLEKYAVRVGGGHNHRLGLFDAVLIKDNHIRAAGSIGAAVERVRRAAPHTAKIEVETESLAQVAQALAAGAEIIMLDNMSIAEMSRAVELIAGRAVTEASGGMQADHLAAVAATGVDVISIGALTHSAPALDLSLDLGELKPLNQIRQR